MAQQITPAQSVAKWSRTELSEHPASQEHFIDLRRMLGQPTPAEHDATGAEYTFEKGVTPAGGTSRGSAGDYGYADVWWRGKFAWEYKPRRNYRDIVGPGFSLDPGPKVWYTLGYEHGGARFHGPTYIARRPLPEPDLQRASRMPQLPASVWPREG